MQSDVSRKSDFIIPVFMPLTTECSGCHVDIRDIQSVEPVRYGDRFVLRIRRFDGSSVESNFFRDRRIAARFARLIDEVKRGHRPIAEATEFLREHRRFMSRPLNRR